MKSIIVLYLVGTFSAAVVAVVASFIFPIKLILAEGAKDVTAPGGIDEVLKALLMNLVDNPVNALVSANYIGILTWAIIFGIALKKAPVNVKETLNSISEAVSQAVKWIINCAPFGIMGLDEDTYTVSIPLGATVNMAGASVTIAVLALAAAYTLGIKVDIPTAVILSFLAAISACGASGVAGGSLLLIPLACSLFGIPNDLAMQVVGVGFIIGVLQDSCETALNSSTDVLFTATAELRKRKKEGLKVDYKSVKADAVRINAAKALAEQEA